MLTPDDSLNQQDCEKAGGHWDETNTVTGIYTDADGNVKQITFTANGQNGSFDATGLGVTLDNVDQAVLQAGNQLPDPNADVPIYGIGGMGGQIMQQTGALVKPFTKIVNCATLGLAAQIPGGTKAIGAGNNDTIGQTAVLTAVGNNTQGKFTKTVAEKASKVESAGLPEIAEALGEAGAKVAKFAPRASLVLGVAGGAYMVYDASRQAYTCYKKD